MVVIKVERDTVFNDFNLSVDGRDVWCENRYVWSSVKLFDPINDGYFFSGYFLIECLQYIDKDNRMALMRLLADLVAGMSAACEVEPEQECDTA